MTLELPFDFISVDDFVRYSAEREWLNRPVRLVQIAEALVAAIKGLGILLNIIESTIHCCQFDSRLLSPSVVASRKKHAARIQSLP
jgi:hypothetical protein